MTDSETFWSAASAPRTPLEAIQRARRAANSPAPREPSGDIAAPGPIDTVASMDAAAYAQHRDQIMAEHCGGPRPSSEWMGGVDLPQPRTGLTDDEVAQLMPWRTIGPRPVSGRQLDPEYREAQIAAQQNVGLAVPTRYERS